MKHFGDITKISGYDVPIVDIVVGGSPCQDLSIAGKRAGLQGERSGLFMEQIRIIKEMREKNERELRSRGSAYDRRSIRPRYMVFENVCGAFSSNAGEDFRVVLEEICKIEDKTASIPRPPKGKWSTSGAIVGDGWSIAWRVHDAQFWGVPQRRKRISLVADFGGESAAEILFERESLPRNPSEMQDERKETSSDFGRGIDSASYTLKIRSGAERDKNGRKAGKGALIQKEKSGTLGAVQDQTLFTIENHPQDSRVKISDDGIVQTLSSRMGTGGGNVPLVMEKAKIYGISPYDSNAMKSKNPNSGIHEADISTSLNTNCNDPSCNQGGIMIVAKGPNAVCSRMVVRKLTPLECERLQGFPDGWTDIGEWVDSKGKVRKTSDGNRYKALGNSIALPYWQWMMGRIRSKYDADADVTMASLFDGIGGFPLVSIRNNIRPIWASEIEEFPIAVTKKRFGED